MAAELGMEYGRVKDAAEGLRRDGLVRIEGDTVRFSD
jgi:hypothetical protein